MQVKLSQKEMHEAIVEWGNKRGLDFVGKNIVISITPQSVAYATVEQVEAPPQFGPYR